MTKRQERCKRRLNGVLISYLFSLVKLVLVFVFLRLDFKAERLKNLKKKKMVDLQIICSSSAPSATAAFSTRIVATTTTTHGSQYKCVIVRKKARGMVVNQLQEIVIQGSNQNIQETKSSRMIEKKVVLKGQRILVVLLHLGQQLEDTSFSRMSCVKILNRKGEVVGS